MSYEGCDVSYVIGLDERVRLSGTIVTQIIQKKKKIGDFVFPPVPPERGVGEGVVGCMLSKSPGTPALRSHFRFRFGHRLFHAVLFLWVLCCLLGSVSVSAATRLAYDMICILIRIYARALISPLYLCLRCTILFHLLRVCCFICFPAEVFFRSRVGACPVTTDCIATMS